MTFKEQTDLDMKNVFLNTDEFAEDIVYTTKCGTETTIPAVIDRPAPDSSAEDQGRILHNQATILIHNDVQNGKISVDTKGDSVRFPALPGGEIISWDIIEILESSDSHWKLLVTQ